MAKWNQADKASPNLRPRLGLLSKPTTPQQQLQGGLFRRRDLLDRRSFDVGLFALFIGLVQELIDDANTLLLLDPSLLRFLVFGQEFVIYFPAH
jgi:hypothetical protein